MFLCCCSVLKRGREVRGFPSCSLNGVCYWLFRAVFFPALPEELGGDPFKRTPSSSMGDALLMGIQLEGRLPELEVQHPPSQSWGRELADARCSQDVTQGKDCGGG